jgi:NADH:ubiquinone oxidoreductase subunit H
MVLSNRSSQDLIATHIVRIIIMGDKLFVGGWAGPPMPEVAATRQRLRYCIIKMNVMLDLAECIQGIAKLPVTVVGGPI